MRADTNEWVVFEGDSLMIVGYAKPELSQQDAINTATRKLRAVRRHAWPGIIRERNREALENDT